MRPERLTKAARTLSSTRWSWPSCSRPDLTWRQTIKRIVVYPDAQIPYHNARQVQALHSYIHATKPDAVLIIGDFMDFPTPSRWSKGTAAEFQGDVFRDVEIGKRTLGDLRRGYSGPVQFIEGNHDERPRVYLSQYAPALAASKAFNIDVLLDFGGHGVELVDAFHPIAPGWIATHGHKGFSLSGIPGRTALNAAKTIGKSVVIGHVHKLALCPDTTGYQGRTNTLWGVEAGHVMDTRPGRTPAYLKRGAANWQSGFVVLHIDGRRVRPELHPMSPDGSFIADGKVWN
ncbi:metallophosphoesterase [Nonomuraea sp. NPDC023979]|uniref:metallophosphoesterase n=1 Tax=Nonomuraea sp. NPDC023979 TaxID=3154796 RepID=UPI0034025363